MTIAEALHRVVQELQTASRLLSEVYTIGLWSKSDDSSDNRRKRDGLRETDWAISGAHRALRDLQSDSAELVALERDLHALVLEVEQLPGMVSDTMGENLTLDSAIREISQKVTTLMERALRMTTP